MEFPDSYFEDEVREGFYIPSLMKRCWAAQLEVFDIVRTVCKKHHIRCFAEWGTLLGSIRHGGRIPWDDDMDICMLREDYDRFREAAEKELPKECWFMDNVVTEDFNNDVSRVINSRVYVLEGELLEKYHGFPYVAGIDIFLLDYLPDKESEEDELLRQLRIIYAQANQNKSVKTKLYEKADKLCRKYCQRGAKEVTNIPVWIRSQNYRLPLESFREEITIPFDVSEIAVPSGYAGLLTRKYGENWMKPVRAGGSHDYPTYAKQLEFLRQEGAAEVYEYRFSKKEWQEVEESRLPKETLQSRVKGFLPLFDEAHEETFKLVEQGHCGDALELLGECQNVAIQLGTMIEEEQGESHATVRILEQYCETVFMIHQQLAEGTLENRNDTVSCKELSQHISVLLKEKKQEIENSVDKDLKPRKEVVFVPYKASLWKGMDSVWQTARKEEGTDVYVIPAPYFYKDALGKVKKEEPHYETEGYPDGITITSYEKYNFEVHHPDVIVIQCPYDEYNYGFTVHPFFYAKNLKKYTEQLVYIPAFVMDEIGPDDERARETLKSYCNTPGVVYADKVIVQSEQMKQVYVELLTEFAGEDTKEIWESRIQGLGSPVYDYEKNIRKEDKDLPSGWLEQIKKEDGSWKKLILYTTSASALLCHGEKMIEKMKEVFVTFSRYKEEVTMLWRPDAKAEELLGKSHRQLWNSYTNLVEEFQSSGWGIYDDSPEDTKAVEICDACYGDGGSTMNQCRVQGKPVMIQNC
jgi:phosphorylcholine metabolism protein LicD